MVGPMVPEPLHAHLPLPTPAHSPTLPVVASLACRSLILVFFRAFRHTVIIHKMSEKR